MMYGIRDGFRQTDGKGRENFAQPALDQVHGELLAAKVADIDQQQAAIGLEELVVLHVAGQVGIGTDGLGAPDQECATVRTGRLSRAV
jgi:hypothetical protein